MPERDKEFWKRSAERAWEQAQINHDAYLRLWADHGGPALPPRLRKQDSPEGKS